MSISSGEEEETSSHAPPYAGIQKSIRLELFDKEFTLKPGNHIWDEKINAWNSEEWVQSVRERTELSLMSHKISSYFLEHKKILPTLRVLSEEF